MTERLARRPLLLFLGAALAALAVEAAVVDAAAFRARPELLGGAVAFDLLVVVPALWAWLGIRRAGLPAVTLAPVLVVCWLAGRALLPAGARGGLELAAAAAPALELALLAYLGFRVRRIARACRGSDETDAMLRLREGAGAVLGRGRAARLVADEVSMLRYLVRPPVDRAPDAGAAFGYHRTAGWGAIVFALSLAVAAEATAVHFLVAGWSGTAAWVLTALSLYSGLWLVADWRATRNRPLRLKADRLLVRVGLRWSARIPLSAVETARRAAAGEAFDGDGELSTALPGPPDVVLELDRLVTLEGPFGIDREVTRLAVAVDEPEALLAALETARG